MRFLINLADKIRNIAGKAPQLIVFDRERFARRRIAGFAGLPDLRRRVKVTPTSAGILSAAVLAVVEFAFAGATTVPEPL